MVPAPSKETNKHKQLRGIVPEMDGGQNCLCVSLFPGKKGKHINKIPRKSQEKAGRVPGQSRQNIVYVSSCLLIFPALLTIFRPSGLFWYDDTALLGQLWTYSANSLCWPKRLRFHTMRGQISPGQTGAYELNSLGQDTW